MSDLIEHEAIVLHVLNHIEAKRSVKRAASKWGNQAIIEGKVGKRPPPDRQVEKLPRLAHPRQRNMEQPTLRMGPTSPSRQPPANTRWHPLAETVIRANYAVRLLQFYAQIIKLARIGLAFKKWVDEASWANEPTYRVAGA